MVIADTSIWINAQRRPESDDSAEFWRLYDRGEIVMVGPVIAELLHGSRTQREFDALAGHVDALSYLEVDRETWKHVGRIRRDLSRSGSLIGFSDSVTAALAIQHDCTVYTLDGDFERVPGLHLHRPAPQAAHGAARRERRGAMGSPQADAGGSGRSPV